MIVTIGFFERLVLNDNFSDVVSLYYGSLLSFINLSIYQLFNLSVYQFMQDLLVHDSTGGQL